MSRVITGVTVVAGVAGSPVGHSLSPVIHNAWLAESGLDGVYVAFRPAEAGFAAFVQGLRGGAVRGLNITLPFKGQALACADRPSALACAAQAANLLIFEPDGTILADNTDGAGLLAAFAAQAPGFEPTAGPVTILGAGGAARGAAAALVAAGAPQVRIVNRTLSKARAITADLGGAAYELAHAREAFSGAKAVINATSAGLAGDGLQGLPLEATPADCVVMDMVYTPLETSFLAAAKALGRRTVDGLEMLIGQAIPSFEAFYGQRPPSGFDVRGLVLKTLGARG